MNFEIRKPELVRRVNAHIETGQFHDADEVLERALDALDKQSAAAPIPDVTPQKSIEELFAPLRGLNLDFTRNPSSGRPVDL